MTTGEVKEVWDRTLLCIRMKIEMIWEVIAEYVCENLNSVEEAYWIGVDSYRAMFVCSSVLEANILHNRWITIPRHGVVEFSSWNPNLLAINYKSLFKRRWIRAWGLPLNL